MKDRCRNCKYFNRADNTCSELTYSHGKESVSVIAESWVENHDVGLSEYLCSRDYGEIAEQLYKEIPELSTIKKNKDKIKRAFAEILEQFVDLTLRPYVVDEVQRNLTEFANSDSQHYSGGVVVDDDFLCNRYW